MALTEQTYSRVKRITWAWTSDGSGDATVTTSHAYDGEIKAVFTYPSGDAAPTDNYDLAITDSSLVDLTDGQCANRDTATVETVKSGFIPVSASKLTFTISDAGASKEGVVIVWLM